MATPDELPAAELAGVGAASGHPAADAPVEALPATASQEPAPQAKRNKELAALQQPDAGAQTTGRPARRAAAAAQAAIAQTGAYERQRGRGISPPRHEQQTLTHRLLEAVGNGHALPEANGTAVAATSAAANEEQLAAVPQAPPATSAKRKAPEASSASGEKPNSGKRSRSASGSRPLKRAASAASASASGADEPGGGVPTQPGGEQPPAPRPRSRSSTAKTPAKAPAAAAGAAPAAAAAAGEESAAGGAGASGKPPRATPAKRTPKGAADIEAPGPEAAPPSAKAASAKKRARGTPASTAETAPAGAADAPLVPEAEAEPAQLAAEPSAVPAASVPEAAPTAADALAPASDDAAGVAAEPAPAGAAPDDAAAPAPPPAAETAAAEVAEASQPPLASGAAPEGAEPAIGSPDDAAAVEIIVSPARPPLAKEVIESAGADVPSLLAMAAACASVEDIMSAIDVLLPPSKGNNLAARILRCAYAALGLGAFPNRKRSVQLMARALWALTGKAGVESAQQAAASVLAEDLPPALKEFGLTERPAYVPAPPLASPPGPPSAAAAARGSAAAARARGSGSGLSSQGTGLSGEAAALQQPSVMLSNFHPGAVRLAELVRESMGLARGQSATLKAMLKTGLLANMQLRFQNRRKEQLLTGRVAAGDVAGIICDCAACGGTTTVTPSEFEVHAGSKDRRPADGIFMIETGHSLKELIQLVSSPELAADLHMDHCFACKAGGDLVCCDACTAAYHLGCASLEAVPQGDWVCALCAAEGRTKKQRGPPPPLPPPPRQQQQQQPSQQKPASASGARPGSSSQGKKSGGYFAPAPAAGRVHMMAPSLQRRLGRPRNLNRNKRLFEGGEGGLKHGDAVHYIARGERALSGVVVIDPAGASGIRCAHCDEVVSCSQFEAHAGHSQRRQPYEHIFTEEGINLKAVAALLPALPEDEGAGLDDLADGCRDVISDLDVLAGGCVLCREPDFQRGEFGPRTIMLCDQCEREFHVGCLAHAGLAELSALPEGEWYCSARCGHIRALMRGAVAAGQMPVPGAPDSTWQLLNGRDGQAGTTYAIKAAADILQESFDPIMDLSTNQDLLPLMLYARQYGEWDYRGVHTLLLRHKGKPVVAATARVFGPQMAELPLIATRTAARRQGHARVLVDLFQALLRQAGVHTLVLPAAHETVETWKAGFGFVDMPPESVRLAKQQLRILVFPGTEVLWKEMEGVAAPGGHHVLAALPPKAEAEAVAGVLERLVAAVAGEEPPADEQQPAEAAAAQEEAAGGASGSAVRELPSTEAAGALPPPPLTLPGDLALDAALAAALPASAAPGPHAADADPYEALILEAMAAGAAAADAAPAALAAAAQPELAGCDATVELAEPSADALPVAMDVDATAAALPTAPAAAAAALAVEPFVPALDDPMAVDELLGVDPGTEAAVEPVPEEQQPLEGPALQQEEAVEPKLEVAAAEAAAAPAHEAAMPAPAPAPAPGTSDLL